MPLYTLTMEEKIRVSKRIYEIGDDVIASSPWMKGDGEVPHRIVLRRRMSGLGFVVHMQAIPQPEDGSPFYSEGDYCDAIAVAWEHFDRRSRMILGIHPKEHA